MRLALTAILFSCALAPIAMAAGPAPPLPPEPSQDEKRIIPPPTAEDLARIQPPVVKQMVKTRQGYTLEFDRTPQILSVSIPKQELWITEELEGARTVEVIVDGAELRETTNVLARLRKGRILFVMQVDKDWAKTAILENGKVVRGWVQKDQLKPLAVESPPRKNLIYSPDHASAAMLIQKAKQFDDGLYAAVELALQNGFGPMNGKKDWLPRLAAAVKSEAGGIPLATLWAAADLGNSGSVAANTQAPLAIARLKQEALASFLADESRSKPLGFYSRSPELAAIFQQNRMLQTSFAAQAHATEIVAIGKALAADAAARESYEKTLRLSERLTNKLTGTGYRDVLASLDAGETPEFRPTEEVSFLPTSRSPETDLILKLFGNRPIPPDFDLMTEVITRLKDGRLSFEPQPESGWYDHQLWSLEPLVRFGQARERAKVVPNEQYVQYLEQLFKGSYALTRETHIWQLKAARLGSAREPKIEREIVVIKPEPRGEMLPTMYLRRAAAYRFVRSVLVDTFGSENVARLHRQGENGPVELNLLQEIDQLAGIFGGAYVTACRDLGLPEGAAAEIGNGKPADEQAQGFLRWLASIHSDPDLAQDVRMMVPIFYNVQRKRTKVWLMLGWGGASCEIDYVRHPAVSITNADGKPVAADTGPIVIFQKKKTGVSMPVFAEVYVTKLLNRAEFRRHCDVYLSEESILANLE